MENGCFFGLNALLIVRGAGIYEARVKGERFIVLQKLQGSMECVTPYKD